MSIVNVWIGTSRALVGVDSLAIDVISGAEFTAEKLVVLPAAGVAMAGMGRQAMISMVCAGLNASFLPDFDAVAAKAASLVQHACAGLQAMQLKLKGSTTVDLPEAYRFVFVGWSKTTGCMAGLMVRGEDFASEPNVSSLEPGDDYLSAWAEEDQGAAPVPDSPSAMLSIARAQAAWALKTCGQRKVGGHLIVAEVTERSVVTTRFASLDTPDARPLLGTM